MNRHPYSGGACTFCGDPDPTAPQHLHEGEIRDGNHALLCGGITMAVMQHAEHFPGFISIEGPGVDSSGNYLDTITITMKSGKYDVTVRPQQ